MARVLVIDDDPLVCRSIGRCVADMPEVDNQRTRYLTEAEAKTLLAKLQERDTRDWLMSLLSLQCGLRFGEIAKLEVRDLDFENNTIFIRQSKNGRSRFAFMMFTPSFWSKDTPDTSSKHTTSYWHTRPR